MQNIRKKLSNAFLGALLITLCGCSFYKPNLVNSKCGIPTATREVTESTFIEKDGKSRSIYIKIPQASADVKKGMLCLLRNEYINIPAKDRKNTILVTFHIVDKGVIVSYGLNFDLDILLEIMLVPMDESKYLMGVAQTFPLRNIMKSIKNPDKQVIIIPLDQRMGAISKVDAFLIISKITNGLFLN